MGKNFDPDEPGSAPHQDAVDDDLETVTIVAVPGKETETAQALLAAADNPGDVQMSDGNFVVPAKLAAKAKVPEAKAERNVRTAAASTPPAPAASAQSQSNPETDGGAAGVQDEDKAKARAAKKSAPRKAAPRKAAAK